MCDQVCGQKNFMVKKASLYSDRSRKTFTKNWTSSSLNQFLKTFNSKNYFSISLLRMYQAFLSPFLGGRCRYYPSCSNYSIEAYQKHNFFMASFLTLRRLSSCHPLSQNKNYYDPVPLKGVS